MRLLPHLLLQPKWVMPLAITLGLAGALAHAQEFPEPLPPEPIPSVASLATPYPASFAVVHDFGFGSLPDSAFSLVDTATGRFKGMMSAGNFATLSISTERGELYVGETYYSRGTRGDRTDLISVYDMATLDRLAEIELPDKRAAIVVQKYATAVTASGRFLVVFNFTPATSVSVVRATTCSTAGVAMDQAAKETPGPKYRRWLVSWGSFWRFRAAGNSWFRFPARQTRHSPMQLWQSS